MDKTKEETELDAVWCVDSETGEQNLIHYKTGFIIAKKDANGNIIYTK